MKNTFKTPHAEMTLHIIATSYFEIAPLYIFDGVDSVEYSALELNSEGKVRIPISCLLIESDNKKILIDTGLNVTQGPRKNMLVPHLAEAGFAPDDITDIVITHGHNDHIGGILDENDTCVFSQANFWFNEKEFAFLKSPSSGTLGYLKSSPEIYNAIKERVTTVNINTEILPGIELIIEDGHTPGHTLVRVTSEMSSLLHIGDLAVHPLHISHPAWHVKPDHDTDQVEHSREKFFTELNAKNTLVFANHFTFPGLGHITKDSADFQWNPLE